MIIIAVVFLPVLLDVIDYYVYLNFDGMIFFASFIFNLICIPIIFFWTVNCLIKYKNASRTLKNILLSASSAIMLAFEVVMTYVTWRDSRIFALFVGFKAVWWIVCGLWALINSLYESSNANKTVVKSVILAFAAVGLIVNAFGTYAIASLIDWKTEIDGVEIPTLLFTAAFLSICSYSIGKLIFEPRKNVKLTVWFVAIAASDFVKLWLLGTPHTPPTAHVSSALIWILTSAGIFVWSVVGMAFEKRRNLVVSKQQETGAQTYENKKCKKTAKTVIICLSAFAAIVIAVYFIFFNMIFGRVYNDDVVIHSPDGKYTLIVKEWGAFGGGGAEIYGVKSSSPNWIERLMPEKLGETTADIACNPFSRGTYEIEWGEKIIIRYYSRRGSGRDTVTLNYPTNVPIYLNFTALVALIAAVVTAVTLIIIKIVRKRKRKTAEVCEK